MSGCAPSCCGARRPAGRCPTPRWPSSCSRCTTACSSGLHRADLVDGHEAALEALARHTQVDPPYPHAFVAAERPRAVDVGLEAPLPLEQRPRVVVGEVLDVTRVQARPLQGELD